MKQITLIFICLMASSLLKTKAQEPYWEYVGLKGHRLLAITAHPDGTIFAGSQFGIYFSRDQGKTWNLSGAENSTIESFTCDKDGNIFAGVTNPHGEEVSMWKSSDTGKTWKPILGGLKSASGNYVGVIAIVCKENGLMFCTGKDGGFWRSDDYGETWKFFSPSGNIETPIVDMVIGKEGEIIGVVMHRILRSWDDAETWEKLKSDKQIMQYGSIFVSPKGTLFAGSRFDGFFRSKDKGTTWQRLTDKIVIPYDSIENAQSIVLVKDNMIYVSTPMGVFRTLDEGDTWQNAWSGLDPYNMGTDEMCLDSMGYLYVITFNGGVYRTRDRVVSVKENPEELLKGNIGIYPNPTTDNITITFSENLIFKNTKIILRDITGREIFLKELSAGESSYKFSLQEFPVGVYILEVHSGSEVFMQKVSVIK